MACGQSIYLMLVISGHYKLYWKINLEDKLTFYNYILAGAVFLAFYFIYFLPKVIIPFWINVYGSSRNNDSSY